MKSLLERIDGRGYGNYKRLRGLEAKVRGVAIRVLRVQSDPFAPPSVIEARVSASSLLERQPICGKARVAFEDLSLRVLARQVKKHSRKVGEGHSGILRVPNPGPIMIRRSAVRLERSTLRFLMRVGLPSRGRRILGAEAARLLLQLLPKAVEETVEQLSRDSKLLRKWCETWIDQESLRRWLRQNGYVAFVADGSILPRKCGGCTEPLEDAVPFESPPSLRREIELPYRGVISGMGVKEGITIIAGPAFHGKTTLLDAISKGVWNHIPGDGREFVITRDDAVLVESENGRSVTCVDLRSFLRSLPRGGRLDCFTTSSASGATSAASSIQEAVMGGSRLILMDEDNLATNLLHRDEWAERITGKKTIVTITEQAAGMKMNGISLIIVASGALPLLAVADTILVMDEYKPRDLTEFREEARRKMEELGLESTKVYIPPKKRELKMTKIDKWKVRGSVLELSKTVRVLLSTGSMKMLEEEYQVETVVESALTGKDPLSIVNRATIPERSSARPIDAWMLLNKLPILSVKRRHVRD